MGFATIKLVNAGSGLPDGVTVEDAFVKTNIESGGASHRVQKDAESVHSLELHNRSRRTLIFKVNSSMPDTDVQYVHDGSVSSSWPAEQRVGGVRNGRRRENVFPAKRQVTHPATCPTGNGHRTDIGVTVETLLEGEVTELFRTEEDFPYRFTCAC